MVTLIYYNFVVVSNDSKHEKPTRLCSEYNTWPLSAVTCRV